MAAHHSTARAGSLVVAVAAVIVTAVAPAGAQSSSEPNPRTCVPQIGANQLVLPLPGLLDPVAGLGGGDAAFDELPAAPAGLDLPARVDFRDGRQGVNGVVDVVLRDGSLYARREGGGEWRAVPTPDCLDGQIVAMSIDSENLVALDADGWMYTLDNLLYGPRLWSWTRSWGAPIWLGPGDRVPGDPRSLSTWALSHRISRSFVDPQGFTQPTTHAELVQVVSLVDGGARIVYQDPWLPADHSYEIGGPLGGRFVSTAISASESVVFVMNRFGDMYTRRYDLDVAGSNFIPFRYSWQQQDPVRTTDNQLVHRVDPGTPAVSLPAAGWRHQPKIPGEVTSRISVIDTGTAMEDKELRVEGRADGRTGFWHKPLESGDWAFTATDSPLAQPVLAGADPGRDQSTVDLAAPSGLTFEGPLPGGWTARTVEFDWAQTSHAVTLTAPSGREFEVALHTTDALRQLPRGRGLDDNPRQLEGALDLRPADPWAPGNEELADFARTHLAGRDVFEVGVAATTDRLVVGHPVVNLPQLGVWTRR